MDAIVRMAALVVGVGGAVAALLTVATVRHGAAALGVLLDFLLAAAVLLLTAQPGPVELAAVAGIVGVRLVTTVVWPARRSGPPAARRRRP